MQRHLPRTTRPGESLIQGKRMRAFYTTAVAAALLTVIAGSARADSIDPVNPRPVPPLGPSGEPALKSILNGLFGPSWGSIATGQEPAGMYRSATSSATIIPTLVAEYAAYAPINVFGIWFGTATSAIFAYDLLLGPATVGSNAAVSISEGRMTVGSSNVGDCTLLGGSAVNCGSVVNSLITPSSFGFYFRTGSGSNQYSVDALNPGGEAHVLAFQQGTSTNYALAFEDLPLGVADRDYNDMVVKIESVVAVPEPASALLLLAGLGVLGVAAGRRRTI